MFAPLNEVKTLKEHVAAGDVKMVDEETIQFVVSLHINDLVFQDEKGTARRIESWFTDTYLGYFGLKPVGVYEYNVLLLVTGQFEVV